MARRVFYSFHYKPDSWRASKVRNMGVIEGNRPATDNDWEEITGGGAAAIKEWIDDQLSGKSCAVVLVGAKTAKRKWIDYEIETAWNAGKGVLGIHIHNITDQNDEQASKGANPFAHFNIGEKKMSSVVKCYSPTQTTSSGVYNHIKNNLADWVEEAIEIRNDN